MAFFKRLSDSLWDYVSPRKSTNPPLPTPQTEPIVYKKPTHPARARKPSLHDIERSAKSMSPSERVKDWRVNSPSSQTDSSITSRKRKRPHTPSSSAGKNRNKQPKIEVEDMDYRPQTPVIADYDQDSVMGDGDDYSYEDHSSHLRTPSRRYNSVKSPTLEEMAEDLDEMSLVVDDEEYRNSPPRRKIISLPEELGSRHLEEAELRANGWDDDYITLIRQIAARGYEPVLPAYMQFEYSFLPDGLFAKTDEAVISSIRGNNFRASKALEKLFELGSRIRDREYMGGTVEPEEEARRAVTEYMRWAAYDSQLDGKTAIPILVQEYVDHNTNADILKENAEAKCRELARRWKEAFRVARSVEFSPASRASNRTLLSYEMPTFYAIVGSCTLVGIMAYRVDTDQCTPMSFFDYKDKDYDVWNSLALAITICHARDVQIRIAEETMIGLPQPGSCAESFESDDPDA